MMKRSELSSYQAKWEQGRSLIPNRNSIIEVGILWERERFQTYRMTPLEC